MLRSIKTVMECGLHAKDGEIGSCDDFLFDDEKWGVRYLVANTGGWLLGRRVLISPLSMDKPDWEHMRIPIKLTKEEIEKSPLLSEHEPVSRQFEKKWHIFFNYPFYWMGDGMWGGYLYPDALLSRPVDYVDAKFDEENDQYDDIHLRSWKEIIGHYKIHATDEHVGHVEDLILEDTSWAIRYMLIDTRDWLPGQKVVIPVSWISDVTWETREVVVDVTAEQIKSSPSFDPDHPVSAEYEKKLFTHYGKSSE